MGWVREEILPGEGNEIATREGHGNNYVFLCKSLVWMSVATEALTSANTLMSAVIQYASASANSKPTHHCTDIHE